MTVMQQLLFYGPSGGLPSAYSTLINSFSTKYYVDPSGSNSNSGSESSPWASIKYAISAAASGSVIVVKPGTYSETNTDSVSYGEAMVYAASKTVTIVGYPGYVIWQEANDVGRRDNHILGMQSSSTVKIYGIIFKRDNNGRTNNYSTAIWGYAASATYGECYNCVFEEVGSNGRMSHVYDNSYSGVGKLYNCTIKCATPLGYYTGSSSMVSQNMALSCSSSFTFAGTTSNIAYSQTLDPTYAIVSPAANNTTYGVYSGTYAWGAITLSANVPTGYNIGLSFNNSSGGVLSGSTWTVSAQGTPSTYYSSTGGYESSGGFSGSGRSVNANYYRIDQMPIIGSTDMTFSIWYKGTQNVSTGTYGPPVPLFGDTRGSVYGGLGIYGGYATYKDAGTAYQSTSQIVDGNWHHVVFSMNTSKTLKIYVDGVLEKIQASAYVTTSYHRPSDIGSHYPYGSFVAPTMIDNALVYGRILSDAEVYELYLAGNIA